MSAHAPCSRCAGTGRVSTGVLVPTLEACRALHPITAPALATAMRIGSSVAWKRLARLQELGAIRAISNPRGGTATRFALATPTVRN
jgi:hypothetical protein